MTILPRVFELDPFDLLWRDLFETKSNFSAITQKVTHPVDIYETKTGIEFQLAAVGLNKEDIEILVEGDQLRIKYIQSKDQEEQNTAIYKGIKRSSFDLSWKLSAKFDLSKLEATLDKGLLVLSIPHASESQVKKIEIKPITLFSVNK